MELPAADERRHLPPAGADSAHWREVFDVAFWTPRATFGGHLTLVVGPGPRCCFWTSVLEEGRAVVTIVEHDVTVPRSARSLEVRAQGLWADQNCEQPFEHWSYGLEAFALRLDRPEDALGDGRGERVGLGYDLEWESVPGSPPAPSRRAGRGAIASPVGSTARSSSASTPTSSRPRRSAAIGGAPQPWPGAAVAAPPGPPGSGGGGRRPLPGRGSRRRRPRARAPPGGRLPGAAHGPSRTRPLAHGQVMWKLISVTTSASAPTKSTDDVTSGTP